MNASIAARSLLKVRARTPRQSFRSAVAFERVSPFAVGLAERVDVESPQLGRKALR
jgi:hypothetical protein